MKRSEAAEAESTSLRSEPLSKDCQNRAGSPKVDQYTITYMINEWNAKLLKPQRLVGIGLAEEEKRCLGAWQLFDWVLRLAAFEDVSELGEHVMEPEKFRANLKKLVLFASDQMP